MADAAPDAWVPDSLRFARRLASALLRDDGDADDAAQDAVVAAVTRGPGPAAPPRGWLARVVRHAAARLRRAAARRSRREAVVAGRGPSCAPAAVEVAARAELLAAVTAALARLPAPAREALLLRHDAGLPPREIARRLGVPVETVKSRLARGLEALRADLAADPRRRDDAAPALALPPPSTPATARGGGPRRLVGAGLAATVAVALGVATLAGRGDGDAPAAAPAAPEARAVAAPGAVLAAAGAPAALRPRVAEAVVGADDGARGVPLAGPFAGPFSTTPATPRLGDGARDLALAAASVPVAEPTAVEVAVWVDDRPAARDALRLEAFDAALDATLAERRLPLDADGVGRLATLPPGTYRFWLDGPGAARRWWPFVHGGPASSTGRRLVLAVGRTTVRGRVFHRDGRAGAGVAVGVRVEREGVADTLVEGAADGDGRYELDHVPPGRGVLFATLGGPDAQADEHLHEVLVPEDGTVEVDLGTDVAAPLWTGTVVGASGAPVRGPGVLHGGLDRARGGQIVVAFDADGRFAARVPAGPHAFTVAVEARPGAPARGAWRAGPVVVEVTPDGGPARVQVPGGVVTGRVEAGPGGGRPREVALCTDDGRATTGARAPVAEDGQFVLEGAAPGRWRLVDAAGALDLVGDDGAAVEVRVPPDADVPGVRATARPRPPR